jgi:hypothetical protein
MEILRHNKGFNRSTYRKLCMALRLVARYEGQLRTIHGVLKKMHFDCFIHAQ